MHSSRNPHGTCTRLPRHPLSSLPSSRRSGGLTPRPRRSGNFQYGLLVAVTNCPSCEGAAAWAAEGARNECAAACEALLPRSAATSLLLSPLLGSRPLVHPSCIACSVGLARGCLHRLASPRLCRCNPCAAPWPSGVRASPLAPPPSQAGHQQAAFPPRPLRPLPSRPPRSRRGGWRR